MFLIKRTLPFFLLLVLGISLGLMALPLQTIEAKEQYKAQPSHAVAHSSKAAALQTAEPKLSLGSDVNSSIGQENRPGDFLFSLLFPQLSRSSFALPLSPLGRTLRVVNTTLQANQQGTVNVEIDSQGDENAIGFSLVFDQTKLTFVSAVRGTDAVTAGATLNVNSAQAASLGKLGIALGLAAGSSFTAGTKQLVVITFSVPSNGNGTTNITFGDSPIFRETVDVNASELTVAYSPGTITITPLPSPAPTLTSISPTTVFAGGPTFTLTANGTGFVSNSVVQINGSARSTTFVNATQITAQITGADIQGTGSFPITVFTPAPGGGTSSAINLAVNNPVPIASSVSPTNTLAGGPNFTLTVNGSGFSSGSVVRFKNIDRVTSFVNSTQLTAQILAADIATPGSASVTVFNPAPGGGASNSVNFLVNSNPAFRIVRVAGATFVGGQNNTVNVEIDSQGDENAIGFSVNFDTTKFAYVSAVKGVDAPDATLNVNSASAGIGRIGVALANPAGQVFPFGTRQLLVLTFSVPLTSSGSTQVSFGDLPIGREIVDGNAALLGATFTPGTVNINRPVPGPLTSILPTSATTGGAAFTLTVNGGNFVSQSVVRVNGSDRVTTFVNSGQLTAQLTAADIQASGSVPITVFTPAPGGGTSSPINLAVNNPTPAATTISPNNALAGGAAFTLTVNGSNFVPDSSVMWNGNARTTTFVNGTQLTAQITAADIQAAGTANVTVFNPAPVGGTSNAVTFTTNNPIPAATTVSPTSTTVGGAAFPLTVNGSNFVNGSVVRWNGSDRVTTFVSGTQLTAQIPAADIAATGTYQVSVFNPLPGGGLSGNVAFQVNNPGPVILNIAPTSGLLNGAAFTLTVNGSSFVSGAVVKWNAIDRTTTFVNSGQLTAQIPASDLTTAGVFPITVVNPAPGGGTSLPANFTVNNPTPVVTTLSANSGVAGDPAFTLTVNGSNFIGSSVVTFEGSNRVTSFISATQLTAQITAADLQNAGLFHIGVTNPGPGGGGSNLVNFTIIAPNPVPGVTSLSPATVTAGGPAFSLTVNGSNFIASSVARYNGTDRPTGFVNATTLTVQISAADIAIAGAIPVTVFNPGPGGGPSGPTNLNINNPVSVITNLSPNNALLGGAAFTLTIDGTGFVNGAVVKWNGSDRSTAFISSVQVTAQILASDLTTAGPASVTVANPAPGGGGSNALSFTVNNPVPAVSGLSPDNTQAGGSGFTLTVNGTGFVSGAVVKWNGGDRTTSFVSSTQVTAQISAADIQSAGTANVTVFNPAPGGGTSGAATFTINNPAPTTISLLPTSATMGGAAFTLTVNGASFVNTSVVKWNGSDRTTGFVSSSQLTAQISASDLQSIGTAAVTVFNPAPGGGTSSPLNFDIINPVGVITSLSPTNANLNGSGFTLTVNGSSFVSGAVVKWNNSDRPTAFVNSGQVTAQIPASDLTSAGIFQITVVNPAPGGGISNSSGFTVNNPTPVVANISQTGAVAGDPGFTLTVNGSNFIPGSVVRFEGNDRITSFVNGSQLTAQIIAADLQNAGTFQVTVFNPGPGGGLSNITTFNIVGPNPTPTLGGLSSPVVIAGGPAFTLTVSGTNYIPSSIVKINDSARTTSFVSSTQLSAQITAADIVTAGSFPITVFNPAPAGGTSGAVNLQVNNPVPVIAGLSPNNALVASGAFTLTVNGSSFINGAVVKWNGADRTTAFVSSTQLTAQIPATDLTTGGTSPVTVVNPAPGGGPSNASNFTVNNPTPTTTSLSQTSAVAGDAAFTMTVNGTNFVNGAVVKWNSSDRVTTFVNGGQVTAQITAADLQNAGTFHVTVTNPAPGGGTSNILDFTVIPLNPVPVISGLSPSSVTIGAAAFTLTVNGSNFVDGAVVKWNGSDRTTAFISSTQVTAQIAAADLTTAGTFPVTVVNPAPGGGPSNALNFTVNNPTPTVASLSQTSAVAGDAAFTMTVNGTNFVSGAVVKWDGSDRATNFVNGNQVTAQITAADLQNAGTFHVTVSNPGPGGGASNILDFTVIGLNPVPVASGLSPASVTINGAAFTLTVNGSNFVNGAVVKWNGSDRTTAFVSSIQVTAQITAADLTTAGTFPVTVFNPGPGGGSSNAVNFAVNNPAPVVTTLAPSSALVGDAAFTLTVNGNNFVSGAVVKWNGSDRTTTFVNSTQITAQIAAADLTTAGTFPVNVFNPGPGGGSSNAVNFAVNNPGPVLLTLAPSSAVVGGAAFTLTVNGNNFISGAVVKWNGSDRTTAFVNSTQVTAQIPASDLTTAGSVAITVFNPAPGGGTSGAVNFAINNPVPTAVTLSPDNLEVGGAAFTLTVNGSDFINTSVVRWNGVARTTTFVSSTQLTAQIPATDIQTASSASITVLNPAPGGGVSGALSFTVNNKLPTVSTIAPTSAIVGGPAFTLSVTGQNFVNGSIVRVNASDRTTTFVSPTLLTALITAADIQATGTLAVTVFTPAPGGGTSAPLNLAVNNPVPTIAGLSPSSTVAGNPAFTLTVNGTNFINGSTVNWNGSARATTFVNATQLTAAISAGDVAVAGVATVTVVNAAPGGGSSTGASFSILTSNSVPQILSVSPVNAIAGEPAFTLTVNGTGFINGSLVKWNSATRTTTFVNANQLTAQIGAGDISAAGVFHVSVTTPPPGGGDSNIVDFQVIQPNGQPALTSLSPSGTTAAGPGFALTVTGNGFVDGSIVRWDGSDRVTTFSSGTQLMAQITAADIAAAASHNVTVFTPAPGGGLSAAAPFVVAPQPVTLQFSTSSYEFSEATNQFKLTVMRTGDTSAAVRVDFETDDPPAFVPCGTPTGAANQRCDFSTAGGTISFAPGEVTKKITILNTNDSYIEGNETFTVSLHNPASVTNPLAPVALGSPAQTSITILDDDLIAPTANPIDDARYFINQHYLDFLNRIPDSGGWDYWTNEITQCGNDATCIHNRRIGVSGAFFIELEFQQTGYIVYRLYKASYGVRPEYKKFMIDRSQLVGGPQLAATTLTLANNFVERPEFKSAYPDSMTPTQFVNTLYDTAQLLNNAAQRQQAIDALTSGSKTRAQVLLELLDVPEFSTREYNPAFVLMQYFGYLRRNPDQQGYDFWLEILNNRQPNNYQGMICSFITSTEYQVRFSSIVTRTNQSCGP